MVMISDINFKGLLSIVIPAFNEQEVLPTFHERLATVLDALTIDAEILYVNDGSRDGTLEVMKILRAHDKRVAILDLSRNFGKEIAMTAGLEHARGDAVVVIDADLQDPPELIPELVKHWQQGWDMVYAQRIERRGETMVKKFTAYWFYRFMQRVGRRVHIPENVGDFRLLSRRAVDSLLQLREQHRFMKGLFAWIGFPQIGVPYQRDPRFAGRSTWDYWRLWNFALDGITSFTTTPLKWASYLGLITAFFSFAYGSIIVLQKLLYGNPVKGYPSLMVVVLFLGGIQLIFLGIIGEYLGRMFDETKRRPLYFVSSFDSPHQNSHAQGKSAMELDRE
ncbi:MAG: glycosyltransferase [Deltaproteobacteria bacterium]|nr:glycosyltransferase [Deltaproteobacteria bacterium]TLN03232.1 MAG: glycosyltransferase family 2 protein [bacterium]